MDIVSCGYINLGSTSSSEMCRFISKHFNSKTHRFSCIFDDLQNNFQPSDRRKINTWKISIHLFLISPNMYQKDPKGSTQTLLYLVLSSDQVTSRKGRKLEIFIKIYITSRSYYLQFVEKLKSWDLMLLFNTKQLPKWEESSFLNSKWSLNIILK